VDSWAPDGHALAAHQHLPTGTRELLVIPTVDGTRSDPRPFLASPFNEGDAVFSPDGRYVAFVSGDAGQREIFIRPFPGPGGQTPVSVGGGVEPAWARNGELFYRRPRDYAMMVVAVATEPTLAVGPPTELFRGSPSPVGGSSPRARYAVTADGQRFLMSTSLLASGESDSEKTGSTIHVVLNWTEELKQRVPVP
jgi:serine/threonine-protein kinase